MIYKVEYYFPGILFADSTTKVLERRDPVLAKSLAPEGAFAFTLYEVEEPKDLGPDYEVIPKAKNRSGRYYLGGFIHYLEEVQGWGEDYRILASNMENNNWNPIIKCCTGNFQPFTPEDHIV